MLLTYSSLSDIYRTFIGHWFNGTTSVGENSIDIISTFYRTFRVAHDVKAGDTVTPRKYFNKGTA